jgi:hypothetical protein
MNEINFTMSSRQRLPFAVAGGVFLVAGLLAIAGGSGGGFQLLLGVVFTAYYFWFARFGATLTPQGVIVRGLTTQRIPWQQIAAVDTYRALGGTGVVLRMAGGGSKRLRAPVTAPLQRDPDFQAKVATFQQWWQHYAGQQAGYGGA